MLTYKHPVRLAKSNQNATNENTGAKKEMMPLLMANAGEENIIKKIGGLPEMKKHLSDLGFVVGGTVTVVTSMAGNVIVNVKDTRVALAKEMAQKIYI